MPSAQLKFKLLGDPTALLTDRPDDEFRVLATRATADGLRVFLESLVVDGGYTYTG